MGTVTALWRHPIKGHGRERLAKVALTAGQTLPGDRAWVVLHEQAKADGSTWAPCANFSRGAKAPRLQGLSAETLPDGKIVLTDPDLGTLTIDPETDSDAFVAWTRPLLPADRAQSVRLVRAQERGMTDTDFPSISLINLATHQALEEAAGKSLTPLRWRGNVLFEGVAPWAEFDWIGREATLGTARLLIRERITRCNATRANEAGAVDCDTLAILQSRWGHQDLGVYAEVIADGTVAEGDQLVLA
jgi:uncharacterized protein YcbX